jgi:hypothetical protein
MLASKTTGPGLLPGLGQNLRILGLEMLIRKDFQPGTGLRFTRSCKLIH